ncbi:MAG: alpha/beta hydrolase [Henriciella sp.]|nr:alpha/beta hydrolase [Henriciella sp.]
MVRWILGILVVVIAAAIVVWWWTTRPLMIRHPEFGTDCSNLVADADLRAKVDCVRVWYGTNRLLLTDDATLASDSVDVTAGLGESGDQLRLGRADVWLPKLIEQGGSRERGETPHVKGSLPSDADKLAEYVFLTRITSNGKETFTATLQDAVYDDGSDAILLFIHGFNVEFDEALVRVAQLSNDLSRDNRFDIGVPVLYSWPSAGALSIDDYEGDRARSLSSAKYLEAFLDILTEDISVTRINVIAHSMGNRVLTQGLEDYARDYLERHNRDDLEFRIMLVAADVERDIFDAASGVFDNLDANVTIYTSDTDRALDLSNILNSNPAKRLGDTDTNSPYIRNAGNYQTIDATAVTTELFGVGHNYYSDNPTVLWDMMCTIGETGPQDRALEIARFGGLPDGEQYYRINTEIDPNSDACKLHRTAFPAGLAPIPEALEKPAIEALPSPAPPPPASVPSRSMTPMEEDMVEVQTSSDPVTLYIETYDTLDLSPHIERLEQIIDPDREVAEIIIRAYTDTVGTEAENRVRSQRYADAVASWFVGRGIDAASISTMGLGETELAIQTDDEVAEPLNRRIEIVVAYDN